MPSYRNADALKSQGCPTWCTAEHTSDVHDDDRWHISEGVQLPAAELATHWGQDGQACFELAPLELEVALEQRLHHREVFVHLGVGDDSARTMRLSIESIKRLVQALSAHLTLAEEYRERCT